MVSKLPDKDKYMAPNVLNALYPTYDQAITKGEFKGTEYRHTLTEEKYYEGKVKYKTQLIGRGCISINHDRDQMLPRYFLTEKQITYSKKSNHIKRIKGLGLESLFKKDGTKVNNTLSDQDFYEKLEEIVLTHSAKLHKKRMQSYKKSDAESAINFLESLSILLRQRVRLNCVIEEGSYQNISRDRVEGVIVDDPHIKGDNNTLSVQLLKIVEDLEKAHGILERGDKLNKRTYKSLVKEIARRMDKIIAQHLTNTEQLAYGKKIALAIHILKKYH